MAEDKRIRVPDLLRKLANPEQGLIFFLAEWVGEIEANKLCEESCSERVSYRSLFKVIW